MPHVHVFLYPGRSQNQKKSLAERITSLLKEEIGVSDEVISVSFEEVLPESWDDSVVKPFIVEKKEWLFKAPGYSSRYFEKE